MTIECVVLMMVFATTSLIIGVVYVSYMYIKDINEAEQQIKESKHRAEVAEKAYELLVKRVEILHDFCTWDKDCGKMTCYECIKKYYTEQAEKELAEKIENAEIKRKDN